MSNVLITGNTFPVKDALKALGARWDAVSKGWLIPETKAEEARKIVANGASRSTTTTTNKPTKCKVCGIKQEFNRGGYPNVRIYKSGECQDCFEERKMGY